MVIPRGMNFLVHQLHAMCVIQNLLFKVSYHLKHSNSQYHVHNGLKHSVTFVKFENLSFEFVFFICDLTENSNQYNLLLQATQSSVSCLFSMG